MKIQLIKATGEAQEVDLPKDIKNIGDLRDEFELSDTTRIIEGGKELNDKIKISKGMKLVTIPKEKQGA